MISQGNRAKYSKTNLSVLCFSSFHFVMKIILKSIHPCKIYMLSRSVKTFELKMTSFVFSLIIISHIPS